MIVWVVHARSFISVPPPTAHQPPLLAPVSSLCRSLPLPRRKWPSTATSSSLPCISRALKCSPYSAGSSCSPAARWYGRAKRTRLRTASSRPADCRVRRSGRSRTTSCRWLRTRSPSRCAVRVSVVLSAARSILTPPLAPPLPLPHQAMRGAVSAPRDEAMSAAATQRTALKGVARPGGAWPATLGPRTVRHPTRILPSQYPHHRHHPRCNPHCYPRSSASESPNELVALRVLRQRQLDASHSAPLLHSALFSPPLFAPQSSSVSAPAGDGPPAVHSGNEGPLLARSVPRPGPAPALPRPCPSLLTPPFCFY